MYECYVKRFVLRTLCLEHKGPRKRGLTQPWTSHLHSKQKSLPGAVVSELQPQ